MINNSKNHNDISLSHKTIHDIKYPSLIYLLFPRNRYDNFNKILMAQNQVNDKNKEDEYFFISRLNYYLYG
jgi:hypothetical protein